MTTNAPHNNAASAPVTREAIERRIEALYRQRHAKEMSDSRAYSNGSISAIDAEIRQAKNELESMAKTR